MGTYRELTVAGVTTRAAARLTGLPRSTATRRQPDPVLSTQRPAPANRLSPVERLEVLAGACQVVCVSDLGHRG